MKRFRFPLRPVAVLRAHYEFRAREAFAAAMQVFVKSEAELAAVRIHVAQCAAELQASRQGRFDAAAAANAFSAYRRECVAESAAERVVFVAHTEMNQRRADYVDAHRKLEVVSRLEEKARSAHRICGLREEQTELDDFAGRRIGVLQFSQS